MNTDPKDIEKLLNYLRGDATAVEHRDLERRLLEDNELRKHLLELSAEESALTDWAKSERASASLDNSAFQDAESPPSSPLVSLPRFSKPSVSWMGAAAALIIAISGAIWFSKPRTPGPPGVALLVASIDADWIDNAPDIGANLAAGTYRLSSGSVDLLFSDGAKVSMGGPAVFELKSARHIHLESGQLVASISDEALGFIVTSPHSEVIDLGTEFGLSVSDHGQTDVHVLDGLVEVLSVDRTASSPGVMVAEGQARRFELNSDTEPLEIPVVTRGKLLGTHSFDDLGLQMLRGSVRITEKLSREDFIPNSESPNWINLIAEKRDVRLDKPLAVTISEPGNYRDYRGISQTLPAGTRVNSYLLHFRSNTQEKVRGVIRFDQPVIGILSTSPHLSDSDDLFALPTSHYPKGARPARGLEPSDANTTAETKWNPDEIILSQDRHALAIWTTTDLQRGMDQVRVLTLAED